MNNVSIITRTKNRAILLERAIKSVASQSFPDWEMIIVNDGGDPTPVDALVQAANVDVQARIRVIHNPNSLGMEAASNVGIKASQSKYIVIHDDDDSWAPEFLSIMTAELIKQQKLLPTVKGVACRAVRVLEEIRGTQVFTHKLEKFRPDVLPGLIPLGKLLGENLFAPIQFLYERSAIDLIGLYRESLPVLGDWEFNIRFIRSFDISYISNELAFYHHRTTDFSSTYGNSVIADDHKHRFYNQALKNEWLRDDLSHNRVGVSSFWSASGPGVCNLQELDSKLDLLTRYNILIGLRNFEKKLRHALKNSKGR